jgi:ABC-type nitrate/sulfonate/bicarbonate transport system substrate-binding protein
MRRINLTLIALSSLIALAGCQSSLTGTAPAQLKHVSIGIQTSPPMALVMIAKDKGLFEKEGLDVELKQFTAGKFALEAFLAGSLDFSISGDVPAALASLQGHKFVVPAQIVHRTVNEVRVVARRDEHSASAKEYFIAKKRKLATSIGGGPEFFTYELLKKLQIPSDGVDIVSQKPADMPAALVSESVDAIAIFDPFAYIAEKQMSDQGVTFTDKDIYSELYIIEAHEDARTNPDTVQRLLRGMIAAEKVIQDSPDEAKAIVMKYTGLDQKTLDGVWNNFEPRNS